MCKIYTRLPFLEEIAEEVQLIGDRILPVIPAVYARSFGVFVRYLQPEHFLVQLSVTADEEIAGASKELEGKTELDVLIAYLQGMGLEMKGAK